MKIIIPMSGMSNRFTNVGYEIPKYLIEVDRKRIGLIKHTLDENGIEFRPVISGNLLRHPAFKRYKLCTQKENPNVEILHKNGLYVGNSQYVTKKKIDRLFNILKGI